MIDIKKGLLLLALCLPLVGQDFRGSIGGVITDASGASVAGAKIVAIDVQRRTTSEATSNDAGLYSIQGLLPGSYDLSIEKSGFRTVQRTGLAVAAGDRLGINVALQVGAVSESITVEGAAPVLQTETANRSALTENRLIETIPSAGRNFYQIQFAMPGVVKASNYWGSFELYAFGNMNGVSINGGRRQENESTLEGVSNSLNDRGVGFVPALQAIQEFTTNSNIYDAQYGRVGGGVTQVTLKSGTNQLHGQAYEFLKNDKLNANPWEANAAGEPRAPFKNNTFGFEVNGPIFIPKVLDGRNKLFFLLSYEGLREPSSSLTATTVPTPEELKGNFSKTVNAAGAPIAIYDPLTTTRGADGKYVRMPFAGNVIPTNRINPVASAVAAYIPGPNRASGPDNLNNFTLLTPNPNNYDQWLGKIDYRPNDRHSFAFRYGQTPWQNMKYNFSKTSPIEPSTEFPSTRVPRNWGGNWDYVISPSLVMSLRAGLTRYEGFSGNSNSANINPATLGFSNEFVSQLGFYHFPAFRLDDTRLSLAPDRITQYETKDTYTLQPNLSWMRGRHMMKMGAELRRYNRNQLQPGLASGIFNFNRAFTQRDPQTADATSGRDFASFLLGYPVGGRVDRNIDPAYTNNYFAFFFQDDFKLSRNLTLNLGLRWDYEQPVHERFDRMIGAFDMNAASPLASVYPGLKGGLVYVNNNGLDRAAFSSDRNNWQPRVGVAWSFRPKWVMRAGYGLSTLGQSAWGDPRGYSRPTSLVSSTDGGLTPAIDLDNPYPRTLFPNGLLQPIGSSLGLATDMGQGISAQYRDRYLPQSHQLSFGFQRQIGDSWLAEATYSANFTRALPVNLQLNSIPRSELEKLPVAERAAYFNAQVDNPFAGLLPGTSINGAKVPRSRLLVAFPQYTGVTMTNVPAGRQDYHSLQTMLKRRFSNGLSGQFTYTWSKALEQVSTLNDQDVNLADLTATPLERRVAEFDVTHSFSAVGSYELPFGRGKKFLSNTNAVVNGFLGGWNLTAQFVMHSGFPIPFPNAAPIKSGSPRLSDSQRDANGDANGRPGWDPHQDPWFDTGFFPKKAQAAFTLRDFPTRFGDLRGARRNVWEFSMFKEFPIMERARFQLRGDFNNAFNTPFWPRLETVNVESSRFGTMRFDPQNQTRVVVVAAKIVF